VQPAHEVDDAHKRRYRRRALSSVSHPQAGEQVGHEVGRPTKTGEQARAALFPLEHREGRDGQEKLGGEAVRSCVEEGQSAWWGQVKIKKKV